MFFFAFILIYSIVLKIPSPTPPSLVLTLSTLSLSVTIDTFLMILVPLVLTARLINANVWSYMVFGSLYANWLTLIHSEYAHPWDRLFRFFGAYLLVLLISLLRII